MKKYCERYDVYYDDYTGEYINAYCTDPNCKFCKELPKKLSERCNGCHIVSKNGVVCQGLKTIQTIDYGNEIYLDKNDIKNI